MLELMVESAQQVELGGVERLVLTELTKYKTGLDKGNTRH